jgi:phospholipase D1/2
VNSLTSKRAARWLILGIALALFAAAFLLWRYTPLAGWANPERVAEWMNQVRTSPWSAAIVIAAFVVGGLIMFPLTLLIAATAIVFPAWAAIVLSIAGGLANAITLYFIGRGAMRNTMMRAFGEYVAKLQGTLERSGIIAVAAIRMVPIAPFTIVNLAAGSIAVRFRDYTLGTLLGILPGTTALTAFGHQLREIIEQPTLTNVAVLAAVVLGWIGLSLGLQKFVSRWQRQRDPQRVT